MRTAHGNPTIPLPEPASGRRVAVCAESEITVWESYPLLADHDAVRVDVQNGRYLGPLQDGCLLPAGTYRVRLEPGGQTIDTLQVTNLTMIRGDFSRPTEKWFAPDVQYHLDGQWSPAERGIAAESQTAYVFFEAEMHGELEATFRLFDRTEPASAWGLIARHYNGHDHLRVVMSVQENRLRVQLGQLVGVPSNPDNYRVLIEKFTTKPAGESARVRWVFNGRRHDVFIDDNSVLTFSEERMGGVTVVGLFADPNAAVWSSVAFSSTQPVPRDTIDREAYRAIIRPGNIQQLYFKQSSAPEQNVCWESGVQFGHIGGSELKFTQGAHLRRLCDGPVLTQTAWEGPMPKFVDRSDDVRGHARGTASFYPDRIVLADYVLAWVRRSVGPDFDLLARLMDAPARIAFGGDRTFRDWAFDAAGNVNSLPAETCGKAFPLAAIFPLRLGGKRWFLQAIIGNLIHVEGSHPAIVFGWRCPRGLTASHDFRAAPTVPGIEYGYSIVVTWHSSEPSATAEADLLNLRDDWYRPVKVEPITGTVLCYDKTRECPARAIAFDGCFNRAEGTYRATAADGTFAAKLDPEGIRRRTLAWRVAGLTSPTRTCRLGTALLRPGQDFLEQALPENETLIVVTKPIDTPIRLEIQ